MLRVVRIVFGLALLVAAGWVLWPYLVRIVGTSAVVNAQLVTLRSPVDGQIVVPSASAGSPLRAGEVVLVVEASAAPREVLDEAELHERRTANELAAVEDRLAELRALLDELEARAERRRALLVEWLGRREHAALARARSLEARLGALDATLARTVRLAARGAAKASAVDDLRFERDALAAERTAALATAESLALEREAARAGFALDLGAGESVHLQQTLDLHRRQLVELTAERLRLRHDLEAARLRVARAHASVARRARFAPTAPGPGAVWSASPPAGTSVHTGDIVGQFVDCTRRFLEVTVAERHVGRLEIGTPASVRLRGSDHWEESRVLAVMGAGAVLDGRELAAKPRKLGSGELRILLDHPDRTGDATRFCDVGRGAEVHLHAPTAASRALAWLGDRLHLDGVVERLHAFSPRTAAARAERGERTPGTRSRPPSSAPFVEAASDGPP